MYVNHTRLPDNNSTPYWYRSSLRWQLWSGRTLTSLMKISIYKFQCITEQCRWTGSSKIDWPIFFIVILLLNGLRIKDLIDEANINIETTLQATIPESPPWHLESPIIIYGLKTVKRVDTNPSVFQGLFNDVQDKYFDRQFLYTDGSKDDHKIIMCCFKF